MTTAQKAPKKFPILPVVFGVFFVALISVVVLTFDNGGSGDQYGSPEISGDILPLLPDGANDPAVGLAAPEVVGSDYDGNPVSITNDGNAKVIMFVAHWCPHCQREVPIVKQWLEDNPLPADVDFYTISTSISSTRENYPPSSWLDREGWTAPVIVDDEASHIGDAYGLTAFPFWVFSAADGTVVARVTGGVAPSDLDGAVATLQAEFSG